jgi:hypothetical protein
MYDSKGDTLEHISKVREFLNDFVWRLLHRADNHDRSKLENTEKPYFDEWTPKLSGVTYGSQEYRDMLKKMKPAIDHHQSHNRHHPEYHENGITDMTLVDLVEMLCDWKAATMRHDDGNIWHSLEVNKNRFKMSPAIVALLKNTIEQQGW